MKVLVNEMPNKKEACLFYVEERVGENLYASYCSINRNRCSFKDDGVFGGKCRCLSTFPRYVKGE